MNKIEADIYKKLCDENNQCRHMARKHYQAFEMLKCEVVDFFRNAKRSGANEKCIDDFKDDLEEYLGINIDEELKNDD